MLVREAAAFLGVLYPEAVLCGGIDGAGEDNDLT
jgi:hypothetical protein